MSPDIPVVKQLVMLLILLLGHGINLFMSTISSFVHPMRLTFVEFYKNERSHLVEIGYYQRIERSTIYLNSNDWLYIDATTRPRAFSAGFNHGFK
jgi:hypothetical protein